MGVSSPQSDADARGASVPETTATCRKQSTPVIIACQSDDAEAQEYATDQGSRGSPRRRWLNVSCGFRPEADTVIVASGSLWLLHESLVVAFSKFLGRSVPKFALGQNQKSCDLLNVIDLIRPKTAGL